MNEVALDYNSGFQMALAGLLAETTSGNNQQTSKLTNKLTNKHPT